jgi:hypothetical protein
VTTAYVPRLESDPAPFAAPPVSTPYVPRLESEPAPLAAPPVSTPYIPRLESEPAPPLPPPPAPPPSYPVRASTDASADGQHPRAPSDWIADRAADPRARGAATDARIARHDPSSENDMIIAAPLRAGGGLLANKKLLALIGGGIVLIVVATHGGSHTQPQHVAGAPASEAHVVAAAEPSTNTTVTESAAVTPTKPAPHAPSAATPQGTPAIATGAAATTPAGETPSATPSESPAAGSASEAAGSAAIAAPPAPTPPAPPPARHHPTIGGKKVVLEYDTPTRETPKPSPEEDSAAVARAREAYASGNKRLFAGDATGAVKAYQQSLQFYPGYVAGYRGLGLAYAQQGDKMRAMQAFRTYLSSVPGAKDAPLIKKRLATLQR